MRYCVTHTVISYPVATHNWSVLSGASIVSVTNGNAAQGAGIVSKLGPAGEAWWSRRQHRLHRRKIHRYRACRRSDIAFDSLRIVTGQGGQKIKIVSLNLSVNQDTTVSLEGHRIDGLGDHGWVPVNGAWALSATLRSQTPPPVSDSSWIFAPADTGHGLMIARVSTLACTVAVWARPGAPASIALYPKEGPVGSQFSNTPYLSSIIYSYQAGTSVPLVAKLFDPISVWLSAYETDPALSAQITWTAQDSSGTPLTTSMGTLSAQSGTRFSSRRKWRSRLHHYRNVQPGRHSAPKLDPDPRDRGFAVAYRH